MITYILQYDIPLRVNFFNPGQDLHFWVMSISFNMHLQLVYESSMSSVKSFEFMTYSFDLPNALNS